MNEDKHAAYDAMSGFTLIEMLTVLMIIALTMVIAIPSFHRMNVARPADVAIKVRQMAQLARLTAIKDGLPTAIVIDTARRCLTLDRPSRVIEVPSDIAIVATVGRDGTTTSERGTIAFFSDGSSTGGTIDLQSSTGSVAKLRINWLTGIAGDGDNAR